jgi:hypothetical protein
MCEEEPKREPVPLKVKRKVDIKQFEKDVLEFSQLEPYNCKNPFTNNRPVYLLKSPFKNRPPVIFF